MRGIIHGFRRARGQEDKEKQAADLPHGSRAAKWRADVCTLYPGNPACSLYPCEAVMKYPKLLALELLFSISGMLIIIQNTERNNWIYFIGIVLIAVGAYFYKCREDKRKALKEKEQKNRD